MAPDLLATSARQIGFDLVGAEEREVAQDLPDTFRRLYYHLYTNSDASRAERILEDLSLVLLLKLATEVNGGTKAVSEFLRCQGSSNDTLIPLIQRSFPDLIDEHQRFSLGDDALRDALRDLRGVSLSTAPAHVIGEAFQALIGPRLRGDKGQFFTPRSLVRAMVEVIAPRPEETVVDPACGTGGFLMEAHSFQLRHKESGDGLGRLVGVDKDKDLARLAAALLRVAARGRAEIKNFNSLSSPQWLGFLERLPEQFCDVVLTNPPFGARIGVRDQEILRKYELGHQWKEIVHRHKWLRTSVLQASQDPQLLFLELCVRLLKPGGRLGIVLPEGVFGNKQQGYVWDWLLSQGRISALLDCPRTTFQPGTDTKTNVLFFEKSRVAPSANSEQAALPTRIGVAIQCGHDRRGRTHLSDGRPFPDDFAHLASLYHTAQATGSGWREIELDGADYFVPRYFAEQRPLTAQEAEVTRGARTATIAELVQSKLLVMRKGHEVGSDAYGTGDVPFVRTSDLSNFEISVDPTKSVSEDVFAQFAAQQRLRAGDVLIVVDGRYRIGTTALLTEHNHRCVVQSHLRILSVLEPQELDPYELLFALNLPSVRLRIRDLVFVQSTLGTLGKRLLELRLPILHSDGPWSERVNRFRSALQERARLFSEIQAMTGPEFEL
jgi:type I restriction enzyme M protein